MSFSTSFNTHQHNGRLWLLAICAGLSVANVYELQPGLSLVRSEFGVSAVSVGWLPSLSQLGYALGMLLLAPLGDVLPRRKMIQTKAVLLMFALIVAAVSPSFAWLATVSMCIGMLGSLGQDFVPIAAQWAADQGRGRAIGIVTTGLLSGILLSRTLGGWLAQACGWRALQWIASGLMLAVLLIVRHIVPDVPPATHARYRTLLVSLLTLWRQHRALRLAVVTQALLASTLGAFWSTLALVLAAAPFHLGAGVAGSYGIAGAAGAMAASWFGRFADRHGPLLAIRIGCGLVIVAFLGMQLLPLGMLTLAIGAVVFDLGVMVALVSHQSIVNGLESQARSRLNGLLMTGAMSGMAAGAFIGSIVWAHRGILGVDGLAMGAGLMALGVSFFHRSPGEHHEQHH